MTTLLEAAKQMLDALNEVTGWQWSGPMRVMDEVEDAITAGRQAIAAAEQHKQAEQYDQQALELCERCGWKTLIPGDGCLNCMKAEQAQPVAFNDWYKNAIWGNEDFKAGCHRAWKAALKHTATSPRQPLTDEQITAIEEEIWKPEFFDKTERQANREFVRAIEAAHDITGETK